LSVRFSFVLILAFALAGLLAGAVRWGLEPSHASGDSFWYARMALELHGYSEPEATRAAAHFIVGEGRGTDPQIYVDYVRTIDPRYPAIFESRPIYPLIVSAFLSVANLRAAMVLAVLLAGAVFAASIGWFVRRTIGSLAAAFVAVGLALALPSGRWFAFMYADSWMLAFQTLALAFASCYLLQPRGRYLVTTLGFLALVYLTKPANGAVLVIALILIGLSAWALRTPSRKQAATLAFTGGLIGVTQIAIFALLGLPGFETTLQDLLTLHFSSPDVDDALVRLLSRDIAVLGMALEFPFRDPLPVLFLVGSLAPLLAMRRLWAGTWLMAGLASGLIVLAHPVASEFPRLLAPIWVTAALGGGLWVAQLTTRSSDVESQWHIGPPREASPGRISAGGA
jgi:hypothetical protein